MGCMDMKYIPTALPPRDYVQLDRTGRQRRKVKVFVILVRVGRDIGQGL